jgi:hypothetical protein
MVAMTQLAIPTATPLPPTETLTPTPLPTFTPCHHPPGPCSCCGANQHNLW